LRIGKKIKNLLHGRGAFEEGFSLEEIEKEILKK
jgi:hypothetical protein